MNFADLIFSSGSSFSEKAAKVFNYQKDKNPVYQRFCNALGVTGATSPDAMPLLPIQAFKETTIITNPDEEQGSKESSLIFKSSGTSGMRRSCHYVPDPELYKQSILKGMRHFYELDDFVIWAYAPTYSENPNSSLIWMLNTLIDNDASGQSKFLALDTPLDKKELTAIQQSDKRMMLFGAAFGLLDLLEQQKTSLPDDSLLMETGGMKTHRREMSRQDLHRQLAEGFGLSKASIHSEYGMTELLSQAYSLGDEWFHTVPWMQVSIRNPDNPMEQMPPGEEGLIGIIDLANIHSCSFLLTGDKGIRREDGAFQVLGRWNPQDLRGCNFLIERD
ncbi:MAG: hypothetical protein FH748_14230 [Balneolaceae bacterium]|nr:hypothetical protein [Balneolaceae bacterium]